MTKMLASSTTSPANDPAPRRLFRINEVAVRCGVSGQTIKRWADRGLIPAPEKLKASGRLVYSEQDVEAIVTFASATEKKGKSNGNGAA